MEHKFPLGRSNRENGTTFWAVPLFLGIFQSSEPKKRFPFCPKPEFSEFLIKWKTPQDNIEKIFSEESVILQEIEETPQKTSVSLNVHRVRWAIRRDGVMTCYTSNRRILGPALPLGLFSHDCRWSIVNYHELLWAFDLVNDSWW